MMTINGNDDNDGDIDICQKSVKLTSEECEMHTT